MYVDYVKDVTDRDGDYRWVSPLPHSHTRLSLPTPMSLATARALHYMGVTSPEGLSIVADDWRSFKPVPQTRYSSDLAPRIKQTLLRVKQQGLWSEIDSHYWTVIDHWPFPLWSLDLTPLKVTLERLRIERNAYIEYRKIIEAQRDPPPQVSRDKVEALSLAYAELQRDEDRLICRHAVNKEGSRLVALTGELMSEMASLESRERLVRMMSQLTIEERMHLAAFAWFGRDPESGWEDCHKNARQVIPEESIDYERSLGRYWLRGLERWESDPQTPRKS